MSLNQQIENWLASRKKNFQQTDRPYITLAFAQALDGSITSDRGETFALSDQASRALTHQLRSLHDGILIGIETVLSDDPSLTVRQWQGAHPQPAVLDSRLRFPVEAKLRHHPDKRCWVLTLNNSESVQDFDDSGLDVIEITGGENDFVPLEPAMKALRNRGLTSVMVEGGARVLTEFLKAEMADAIVLTIAPRILGGYKAIGDLGIGSLSQLPRISDPMAAKLEQDLIIWGELEYRNTAS